MKLTQRDKAIADLMREQGFPHTADYIGMFGAGNMNPWFRKPDEKTEAFYKRCVDEKHPWDYYVDPPKEGIML